MDQTTPTGDNQILNPEQRVPDISNMALGSKPRRKKHASIIAAVSAFAVIAGAVSAYLVYFREPSPETVLANMFTKLEEIKSVEYSGTLTAALINSEQGALLPTRFLAQMLGNPGTMPASLILSQPIVIDFAGASDARDPAAPRTQFSFAISGGGIPIQIPEIKFRSIGDVFYVKILGIPKELPIDLGFIDGKWVKIERNKLLEQFGIQASGESGNNLPQQQTQQLTPLSILDTISELYRVNKVFPAGDIDGKETYHYQLTVDRAVIEKTIVAFYEAQGVSVDEAQLAELRNSLDAITIDPLEVWIGKADGLPRRVRSSVKILERSGTVDASEFQNTRLSIDVSFPNYNETVTVEEPMESVDFQRAISNIMLQQLFASHVDSDKDGLPDNFEPMFGADPKKADTDGDGFLDGDEVLNGYNPAGLGMLKTDPFANPLENN